MTPEAWDKCRKSIMRHEGYKQLVYLDSTGNRSIAYGHRLTSKNSELEEVTKYQAAELLDEDMQNTEHELRNNLPLYDILDNARQSVLLELAYNIGVHGMLQFRSMLHALAEEDYMTAADEMLNSRWAEQVGLRANDLAWVMETGNL